MQDLTALEGKTILELREIAKVLGITPSNMKKKELLEKIVAAASGGVASSEQSVEKEHVETPVKRGRRPRMMSVKVGGNNNVAASQDDGVNDVKQPVAAEHVVEEVVDVAPQPKRRGRKPKWMIEAEERERMHEQQQTATEESTTEESVAPSIEI